MLVYWDPRPAADQTVAEVSLGQFCDRDAALCPKHKDELEASLKDIGRWAKEPAGTDSDSHVPGKGRPAPAN